VLQAGTEIPSYLYLMKDGEKLRFDAVWSMDEDLVVDEETDVNGETLYMLSCDKVGTYWLGMRAADTGTLYYMQLECVLPGIGCYSSPSASAEGLYVGQTVPFNAGTEKTFWIVSDLGFTGEEDISLPSSSYRGSELEFEFVDRTDSNTWKALQVTVKDTVETSGHIKLELTGGSDTVMEHMITINMVESTPKLLQRYAKYDGTGWYEDVSSPLYDAVLHADTSKA
jgi:hypothetical protein